MLLTLLVGLAVDRASAQTNWFNAERRHSHAVAIDSLGTSVVMYGGSTGSNTILGDTWVRASASNAWSLSRPDDSPPATRNHALASFDFGGTTGGLVMFGGVVRAGAGTVLTAETWRYDGDNWTLVTGLQPLARRDHAMALDKQRGRVVLFGGQGSSLTPFNDTWEFDGTNWISITTANAPTARWWHGLVFDAHPQGPNNTVMVGGSGGLSDSWEFDGTNWTRHPDTPGFPQRQDFGICYDHGRGKLILFGGLGVSSTLLQDTWEWNRQTKLWEQQTPSNLPPARRGHRLEYDPNLRRVLLVGGEDQNGSVLQDHWEWTGGNWVQPLRPTARMNAVFEYHEAADHAVLYGGYGGSGDTWTWNGHTFARQPTTSLLTDRFGAASAYDRARQRVVMFGGDGPATGTYNETWEWDGTAWQFRTHAAVMPELIEPAMTYHAAGGYTLLFGGLDRSSRLAMDKTYRWDGTNWVEFAPQARPPARYDFAMAYDELRQKTVLFGGKAHAAGPFQDTWEWGGTTWTQVATGPNQLRRSGAKMVYHRARQRMLLFGGLDPQQRALDDVWEWDGTAWQHLAPSSLPLARADHGLTYDPVHARAIVFGGFDGSTVLGDRWEYASEHPATFADFGDAMGPACRGSAGNAPLLSALRLPWIGDAFVLQLTRLGSAPVAFCWLGGTAAWNSIPLPLDLALIGRPGCTIFVALDVVFGASVNAGTASVWLPVPNDVGLVGVDLPLQGMGFEPVGVGLVLTNAAIARIGIR